MEKTSHLDLSNYQQAILNEMGISSWLLTDGKQTKSNVDDLSSDVVTSDSKISVTVKDDALAKLKQLKVQTQTTETTDSVLVTFPPNDTKLQIFNDVLIALDVDTRTQKSISMEQLSHYKDYPLSWSLGAQVSLNTNQLVTPTLTELHSPDHKKQLWQKLQSAFPLKNTQ